MSDIDYPDFWRLGVLWGLLMKGMFGWVRNGGVENYNSIIDELNNIVPSIFYSFHLFAYAILKSSSSQIHLPVSFLPEV